MLTLHLPRPARGWKQLVINNYLRNSFTLTSPRKGMETETVPPSETPFPLHLPRPARGWKRSSDLLLLLLLLSLYTYLAPQGDGNSMQQEIALSHHTLYTYLAPQGDGNFEVCPLYTLRTNNFTLTSPRKGMETARFLWVAVSETTLYTYLAPQGDGNFESTD